MFDKAKYNRKYFIVYPWLKSFYNARRRCERGGAYHKKGIKFLMSKKDFEVLWNRDKADFMEKPSIDRIDSKGNYCLENCRFIEVKENRLQGIVGRIYTQEQRDRISIGNKITKRKHKLAKIAEEHYKA